MKGLGNEHSLSRFYPLERTCFARRSCRLNSGGKVASAIRSNIPEPQFKGNTFAESTETKLDAEVEAAVFRGSK